MSKDFAWNTQPGLLRSVVEHARDAVLVTDADTGPGGHRILYANPAFLEMSGYPPDEILGRTPRMFQGPNTDRDELDRIRAALESARPVRAELVNYTKGGDEYRIEIDVAPIVDEQGAVTHFVSIQRDVSDSWKQQRRIERFRAFRRKLAELTEEGLRGEVEQNVFQKILDYALEVVPGAQAASMLLGHEDGWFQFVAVRGFSEELLELSIPAEVVKADFPGAQPAISKGYSRHARLDDRISDALFEFGRVDEIRATLNIPISIGAELRGLFNLDSFDSPDAFDEDAMEMAELFGQRVSEVLKRVELEETVARHSRLDATTGLPNRHRAEEILAEKIAEARSTGKGGVLSILDLEDFKHVNEAYGHTVGDALIRQVAQRLVAECPSGGALARWTSDEFMIITPGTMDTSRIEAFARAISSAFVAPFEINTTRVKVGASIGMAMYPTDADTVADAIQNAHVALNQAKRSRTAMYAIYESGMGEAAARRADVTTGLRNAIDNDAVELHFQPRIELASGALRGMEALARWTDPELGQVPPGEFIPVAEESGMIIALGEQVLFKACRQAKRWLDAGHPTIVSVNVSIAQLRQAAFPMRVAEALRSCELPGEWIELEITESAAMTDVAVTVQILRALREEGVRLAIDDFGTAYSSLSYLKMLPIDTLKIDRSFIVDLCRGDSETSHEAAIIKAIVALGSALGLNVVAEGVETEAQKVFLQEVGCKAGQGYFFSKPRPADSYEDDPLFG